MNRTKHLVIVCCLSILMIIAGTLGYMLIEGWDVLDALYMTVITVASVGYSEVQSLSSMGRIYTMVLIFSGLGLFVYVAGAVVQFMVEGQIRETLGRRRLDKKISQLENHYIICGYGRIGRVLCNKLKSKPIDLVVIEKDSELIPVMEADNVLHLSGDATNEMLLLKAGIEHAKGLVAVLATDTENVFLVLTARQLNKNIEIIARAGSDRSAAKLTAAGADRVESPYAMGASNMANRILRPTVTTFLDLAFTHRRKDIQMEEIPVGKASALVGKMLKDSGIRQNYNLIIIAIKKSDGGMLFNPSFEATINSGDTLIAVGESGNLEKLENALNP
ncbi:MAG: potassium channel protein [Desulfococcus multivorans]|jgi:voltage-gated potassium channel|uniref:potassium channel family protein n=1 Tax=Desulfococcus sp. TaxID=2025834 RepID=UPI002A40A058|nr:potassium channel protein [Desulfococcus multivorans]